MEEEGRVGALPAAAAKGHLDECGGEEFEPAPVAAVEIVDFCRCGARAANCGRYVVEDEPVHGRVPEWGQG